MKITCGDLNFDVEPGDNLRNYLRAQGQEVKSSCGGHGVCADCVVKVISGENLPPLTKSEEKLLGNVFFLTKERLSCQLCPTSDIEVEILN